MIRRCLVLALPFCLAACAVQDRPTVPPAGQRAVAPATSPAATASIAPGPDAARPHPSAPAGAVALPANAIYVCVLDRAGAVEQTAIGFAPKVQDLCRRHPEMGPCQYERNQCRAAGGRVYGSGGEEITLAREAEYDRKVMRVRLRAN